MKKLIEITSSQLVTESDIENEKVFRFVSLRRHPHAQYFVKCNGISVYLFKDKELLIPGSPTTARLSSVKKERKCKPRVPKTDAVTTDEEEENIIAKKTLEV